MSPSQKIYFLFILLIGSYHYSSAQINCGNGTTMIITTSFNSPTCTVGSSNGNITVSVTGGTSPFSYSIDGLSYQANNTFTGLLPGNYILFAKDATGCIGTKTVILNPPSIVSFNVTKNNATCNGGNDGSITVSASSGTAPYTYAINAGAFQTSNSFSGLSVGSYTIKVKDANGCLQTETIAITSPSLLSVSVSTVPVTCNGGTDGKLMVTATGGIGTLLAFVNGSIGLNIGTLSNYPAGTYNIEVKDILGCSVLKAATISEPTVLSISNTKTDVSCAGFNNGTITTTATGGNGVYEYSLDNITWKSSNSFTGLAAGIYTVYVKDTKGCSSQANITINEGVTLNFSFSSTPASCSGGTNGSITITPTNGTSPYTYEIPAVITTQSSNVLNGLAANSYNVLMTDATGCTVTKAATVSNNSSLVISTVNKNPTCFGGNSGQISLSTTGGTPPYSYSIDNSPFSSTTVYTNLIAKTYSVQVKDTSSCIQTTLITLTQPSEIEITATQTAVYCNGDATGAISAVATGGNGNFQYSKDNSTYASTNTFNNLSAGVQTIYAKDAKGCINQKDFNVTEPTALVLTDVQNQPSCFNGSDGQIALTATGGTSPYTYKIDAGTYTSSNTFTNLNTGTHTVYAKDANGCIESYTTTLASPTKVTATGSTGNVSCFGGSDGLLQINATGGNAPYTYSYNNNAYGNNSSYNNLSAGTYNLSVLDSKGCEGNTSVLIAEPSEVSASTTTKSVVCYGEANGKITVNSTGGTSPYTYQINSNTFQSSNVFNVPAGSYTITVSDANACTKSYIGVEVTQPNALTAATAITHISCNNKTDGSITINATEGVSPYQYALNTSPYTNNPTFNNLGAGTYTLNVRDASGCTFQTTATITEPSTLTLTLSNSDFNGFGVSCNGGTNGTISSSVTGGTAPYAYTWSNGPSTTDNTNVSAGSYTLNLADANGCITSATSTLSQPQKINIGLVSANNVSCNAGNDGAIDIEVNGGASPYTYSWSNSFNSQDLNNLKADNYILTVTDANTCTENNTYNISEPTPLVLDLQATNASCSGNADGAITSTISGGTGPYLYNWSNAETTANIADLDLGTYTLTISDSKNCTISKTATINSPNPINIVASTQNINCYQTPTGAIDASATNGGFGTLNYTWNNGATGAILENLLAGDYSLTVTDANGCSAQQTYTLTEGSPISFTPYLKSVSCNGGSDAVLDVTIVGGSGTYTETLVDEDGQFYTSPYNNLSARQYTFTAQDDLACTKTQVFIIGEPSEIQYTTFVEGVLCSGTNTGSATITINGGVNPYTIAWQDGSNKTTRDNLTAGKHSYTISDANGCTKTDTLEIIDVNPITLTIDEGTEKLCDNSAEGIIRTSATGGSPSYNFLWTDGFVGPNRYNLVPGKYALTVTDNKGCEATISHSIKNIISPNFNVTVNPTMCDNLDGSFSVSSSKYPTTIDEDGPGRLDITGRNGKYNAQAETFGTYTIFVSQDNEGCTTTKTASIAFANSPTPSFYIYGEQPFTTANTRVIFENTTIGADKYTWDFGFRGKTSSAANPSVEFPYTVAGTYTICLDAIAANGCSQMICRDIKIQEKESIYIPTAFTPGNGDGRNDIFTPVSRVISDVDYAFRIFNRFGEEVFYSPNPNEGWDGTYLGIEAPEGVYVYSLHYRSTDSGSASEKAGHVNLIR